MIVGHYATALFPRHRFPRAPFWLFLLCAQLADFLWLAFAFIGLEPTDPKSFLDASLQNLHVNMLYSHNLMPTLLLAATVTLAVLLWRRGLKQALWCGALVVLHFLCDLIVGYEHGLFGRDSSPIGLNLYYYNPYLALCLEAAFGATCVAWFVDAEAAAGRPLSRRKIVTLYSIFIGGALIWLPIAVTPLRSLLGL
ncbi:MAG: hypothetical protein ACYCW6_11770 [Candidatus Xenobia bacterium]